MMRNPVQAKRRIWREGDTMYYPLDVTDPEDCVLRFTADKGRYYSKFHSEDFIIEEENFHEEK